MDEPYIRDIGQVTDVYGQPYVIGVDHDAVSLDGRVIGRGQLEELAQLIVRATWGAGRQVGTMGADLACPADCGEPVHDENCRATASGPG